MYFTTKLCCIFLHTYEELFVKLFYYINIFSAPHPIPAVFCLFVLSTIHVELPQPGLEPMPNALAWNISFFLISNFIF